MYKKLTGILFLIVLGSIHLSQGTVTNFETLLRTQKKEIWKDLEGCDFYHLDPGSELCSLIARYNSIEKTDKKKAPDRIKLLKQISSIAQREDSATGQLIHQTAENKSYYLEQLLKLREKAVERAFRVIDTPQGKKMGRGVQIKYSHGWAFDLDPAFRDNGLSEEFSKWENLLESNPHLPDFYFWLEGQPSNFSVEQSYARSASKEPHFLQDQLVVFDETGKAYTIQNGNRRGTPLVLDGKTYYPVTPRGGEDTESGYLYNIDRAGRLYISQTGPHSIILRGDILLSAGWINFDRDSFISYLSTASGHYTPSASHLKRALEMMRLHYKNDNIFKQMKSYMIEGGPQGRTTTPFEGIEEIPNMFGSQVHMSFVQLYEKRKHIPEDLWQEIWLCYQKYDPLSNDDVEARQTLGDFFSDMGKIDWAREKELEKEVDRQFDYLNEMARVQAKLTQKSQEEVRHLLFTELDLKPYLGRAYKQGVFSEDPKTSSWFERISYGWDPSRNPQHARLLKEIQDLPHQKGLQALMEIGSLYLDIQGDRRMSYQTPWENWLVSELVDLPYEVRRLNKKFSESDTFLKWKEFDDDLEKIFPQNKAVLELEFETEGHLKIVPITYQKELDDYRTQALKLSREQGRFQKMSYSREWKQVSPAEWKEFSYGRGVLSYQVIYTAPPGKDFSSLLNVPVRQKAQKIWAANVIKRSFRAKKNREDPLLH